MMRAMRGGGKVWLLAIVIGAVAVTAAIFAAQNKPISRHKQDWDRLGVQYEEIDGVMQPQVTSAVYDATRFGDQILVSCDQPRILDLKTHALKALELPGAKAVLQTADDGKGHLYALGATTPQKLTAFCNSNGSWRQDPVPAELQKSIIDKQGCLLAGDGDTLAVLAANGLFLDEGGQWRKVKAPDKTELKYSDVMNYAVLRDGSLYYGENAGEFGGGFYRIDTKSGTTTQIMSHAYPGVKGLTFAADGKLWLIVGLNHMLSQSGGLYSYDGQTLTCHSKVDGMTLVKVKMEHALNNPLLLPAAIKDLSAEETSVKESKNWNLHPAVFTGLAFDDSGAPVISASPYGLLRFKSDKWERLTEEWPDSVVPTDVVIKSGVAVVPVSGHGIVLFDMQKRSYQFLFPPKPPGKTDK